MIKQPRMTGLTHVVAGVCAAGALLGGCSTQSNSVGMMPGPSAATRGSMGAVTSGQVGMMGDGYTAAPLSCQIPEGLSGLHVDVTLGDMGMSQMMDGTAPMGARMLLLAQPATVRAGQVTFLVANRGWRTHELVVLPLATAASAGQRVPSPDGKVDEAGSLGEASNSCAAGSGEGIASGSTGWVTITLAAGHYELICNLPNHYANGMRQELVVTS